jgi:uncharacterized protein
MKISCSDSSEGNVIQSYGSGQIRINQQTYTRSVLLMPDQLHPDWEPQTVQQLEARHVEEILDYRPELILLGTGERQNFPEPAILRSLSGRHIGLEVMDTAAACRTYNIVMAEGRRVLAGLMMI